MFKLKITVVSQIVWYGKSWPLNGTHFKNLSFENNVNAEIQKKLD